jgi:hypothetical protein
MAEAPRDQNYVPTLLAKDSSTGVPFPVKGDATTGRIFTDTNAENMGLGLPEYDYVSMALSAGDTTETYTFKSGGSGGTTVATVVVVYTTSTRSILSSVTKT